MAKIRFCPKCKKSNIVNVRGDSLLFRCVDCGLEMAIFPEKDTNAVKRKIKPKNS